MILALAILAAVISSAVTALAVLMRYMSGGPFVGGWDIAACWAVTAGLFLGWALR